MGDTYDDPRQVLALLNSLGFVGVTALQLKNFLKDLKMYRKVKEHKRHVEKENIREKILMENQHIIEEMLQYQLKENNSDVCNVDVTSYLNNHSSNSPVKVKIRCNSKSLDKIHNEYEGIVGMKCNDREQMIEAKHGQTNGLKICPLYRNAEFVQEQTDKAKKTGILHSSHTPKYLASDENACSASALKHDTKHTGKLFTGGTCTSSTSAPNSFTQNLQHKNVLPQSARSTAGSYPQTNNFHLHPQKSFIRPWQLQQGTQTLNCAKKSDPVSLYQKYQKGWKKMDFPGEATHSNIRWAVRQKMLGDTSNLVPLSKNQTNWRIQRRKQLS